MFLAGVLAVDFMFQTEKSAILDLATHLLMTKKDCSESAKIASFQISS